MALPLPDESLAVEPDPSSKAQWPMRPEVGAATWASWVAEEIRNDTTGLFEAFSITKKVAAAAATSKTAAKRALPAKVESECGELFMAILLKMSLWL